MFVCPSRHDNFSADIEVECCGRPLDIVKSYKYLGVMFDSDLNWSAHMAYVARKVSWKIAALQRAGQKLNHAAKQQYYLFVIQSDLEYGSNVFFSDISSGREKADRTIQTYHSGCCRFTAVVSGQFIRTCETLLSMAYYQAS